MENTPATDTSTPPLILLVDDEKPFTDLFTGLLEDGLGMKTVAFNEPAAALAALDAAEEAMQPTLVISDLLMPRMNGFEFLRAAEKRRPGVASVLVTGSDPDAATVAANQPPGFLGVLHKPVSWRDIAALMKRCESGEA